MCNEKELMKDSISNLIKTWSDFAYAIEEFVEYQTEETQAVARTLKKCSNELSTIFHRFVGPSKYKVAQETHSGISAIIGKWPGEESDEQIADALKNGPA